jgi:glucosamine--fructose-6-phosphate aminotransferase (isomerizing)
LHTSRVTLMPAPVKTPFALQVAFETIAGLRCEPVGALPFLEYRTLSLRPDPLARPLVIAISASGGTERVVQAIETARRGGALTIALTGTPGSAVTRAADRSLVISLPGLEPSPGIRTCQASLLGLLFTATRLGEARQHSSQPQAQALRPRLPVPVS